MELSTMQPWLYLASTIMFILGIKQLSRVKTARRGNTISAIGMGLAVLGTLVTLDGIDWRWIAGGVAVGAVIGVVLATRVAMTAMPELVAALNGVGGMSSALVAGSFAWRNVVQAEGTQVPAAAIGSVAAGNTALSILIGMLTLTGSVIAFLKLQGRLKKGAPILLPGRHVLNAAMVLALTAGSVWWCAFAVGPEQTQMGLIGLMILASALGVLVVIPIGGADMPVVVSLLNAYSGLAAAAAGFVLGNALLLIAGAMVGASGLILTQIMCVAMNRT
ncbi:MAG: NAD(P)(+) transhydrogenase (Re/Si-specific) subunit beta, partial [Myxococcota bacterium]